jgi:lipopolysaccharide/colanic/teichoic acid biosynthesis glycosyltransferase
MVPDAEEIGAAWTMDQDPRVTKVGRLLRRTALDELPEVINIWRRDMSLVGPRALDVEEQRSLEKLIVGFEGRLKVRPGLTGLAQIYDPRDDAHEKFHYDLEYLQRMSPWLDIKLLILSVRNTLGVKWDRRSGKMSVANGNSDSSLRGRRQHEATSEDNVETDGGL